MFSILSQQIKTVYSMIYEIIKSVEWNSRIAYSPLRTVVNNFHLLQCQQGEKVWDKRSLLQ